jgi:outer membrane biosynthesis protein TonB
MNVSRPKALLLGLAVVGALVAGCQPTSPAADGTSAPAATTDATTDPALADPTDPAAGPTTVEPPATVAPTTRPPATTAAKPATTKKPATHPTTHKPTPKPKPTTRKPTTKPPAAGAVHPGAFCSPEGATGHTSKGTLMRCTRKAGEKQARWRAA